MEFRYTVIDEKLHLVKGVLEAADRENAQRIIFDNRWQLVELTGTRRWEEWLQKTITGQIKYEAISAFCRQMAMMVRSGASLVRGLEILQNQAQDRQLKKAVAAISRSVGRGNSLASALRDTEGAMPELLISLVAVGEESGNLDAVLTSMAEYYERENFVRKKVGTAAVYPVILSVVLIGLVSFFMGFILPEITDLIKQNGQHLPLITQFVINTAHFIQTKGWLLLLAALAVAAGFYRLAEMPKYRYYIDAFVLRLPLLGTNIRNVVIARVARTLTLFLHSAVPVVPILNSLERIVGNAVPTRALSRVREAVIRGEPLAQAFAREKFFDPLLIQMMSIGEETGRLEELMGEVANHYDKKVELGIARLVALVEPIFTIVIGVFAGGMIIAIALPILNMANMVNK
ncbi:type II secretion system protein F [Peptococcaceae bacterium CEB3]|nr:type II secretion system protein F [Peptococcaceae bacterium CEB3]